MIEFLQVVMLGSLISVGSYIAYTFVDSLMHMGEGDPQDPFF